ncbi:unnamed protein product [Paramecium pentaurelia]|uniref:EamA domain-containing protein n=1 Tax=Paramecium pentaurelia TaxID=43138 RepID=A0A8S1TJ60_9CILI|nr:unnamed protein product [Paramecium pentaurelia]
MGEKSSSFITLLITAMILSGAANTIVYKLQNTSKVSVDGWTATNFNHPFMQAVTMFLGESLCILLFLNIKKKPDYKQGCIEAAAKGLKTKVNYGWVAIPAMCDLTASTLAYISLNYIPPSIYQMLRGGAIISTAIMSTCFLKRHIKRYQWFGCFFVLVGITLVGMSSFLFPPKKDNNDDSDTKSEVGAAYFISVGLLLLSVVMNGLQFVSEEKLFDVYYLHPFEIVGIEGLWGFSVYVVLAIALTFIQCPTSMEGSCIQKRMTDMFYFERADFYFLQIFASGLLLFWVILGIFTIATFNICGVSVTKYVSSLARSLVDVSRTLIIWAVSLAITWIDPEAKWENTRWEAIVLELIGFFVLVTGNLIYNGTIKLKFLDEGSQVDPLNDAAQQFLDSKNIQSLQPQ